MHARRKRITLVALIGQLGRGGSERQLTLLMSHLDANLFDRHVVVFNPSKNDVYNHDLRHSGVTVWAVPANCRSIGKRILFLFKLFRKLKADVIHSWTLNDNPYCGVAGWLSGVPVRWGAVRGSLSLPGFRQMPAIFRWLSLHCVEKLIVNSKALVDELISHGVAGSRITLLHNVVVPPSVPEHSVDLSEFGIQSHNALIALIGNLRPVKNHRLFIDAMARVIKELPNTRGLIVGQAVPDAPGYTAKLNLYIDQLGLTGKVILTGYRSDISGLLHQVEISCLTSSMEGTPNALLEAMAVGLPVVATAVGGVPDLITQGKTGLLVQPDDVDGFSKAITSVLKSPDLKTRLGDAAKTKVLSQYGCPNIASELGKLYKAAAS